jgi:hypothetical protein
LIDLVFQLVKTNVDIIEKSYSFISTLGVQEKKSHRIDYKLNIRPLNTGQILAKYINYFVFIPTCIVVKKQDFDIEGDYCVIFGDNTTRDLTGFVGGQKQYGPFRYDPILPGIYGNGLNIDLSFDKVDANNLPCIRYEMHADNAPTRTITIEWNKIECLTKTKTETKDPMAPPYVGY